LKTESVGLLRSISQVQWPRITDIKEPDTRRQRNTAPVASSSTPIRRNLSGSSVKMTAKDLYGLRGGRHALLHLRFHTNAAVESKKSIVSGGEVIRREDEQIIYVATSTQTVDQEVGRQPVDQVRTLNATHEEDMLVSQLGKVDTPRPARGQDTEARITQEVLPNITRDLRSAQRRKREKGPQELR